MSLPLKTTADDIRAISKYLKAKPTGATVGEAKAVNKSMVDGRKVAAYVAWGVVDRKDGRLKLTARGLALARDSAKESSIFREIVSGKAPYRSVIEWAYHQEMAEIDTNDVATNWHEYHRQAVGEDANDATLRDNAVCFFNVAAAADLGNPRQGPRRETHPPHARQSSREVLRRGRPHHAALGGRGLRGGQRCAAGGGGRGRPDPRGPRPRRADARLHLPRLEPRRRGADRDHAGAG